MIQVGTGGFGATWCRRFLPAQIEDGRIEVVAAVDRDPAALGNARHYLRLPAVRCYTSARIAFREHPADFCTVVVPPSAHEEVVDLAVEHGLHILSEKPIADSVEASVRIVDKVRRAGRKMGVTMSHRFDQDKTTLREELRSGRNGRIDYVGLRLTCNCRAFGSWEMFRHKISDPLLLEAAVHHLDILVDLVGEECELVWAEAWNPPWAEYAGPSQALVTLRFRNGSRAFYEGAKANAVWLNGWTEEYIRAECEHGTVICDHRRIERFPHDPDGPWAGPGERTGELVPLLRRRCWAHEWLIEQFVDWLDGGPPMATNVEDNLRSVVLSHAAIESGRTGRPVRVEDVLRRAREAVRHDQDPAMSGALTEVPAHQALHRLGGNDR
jgi:predicted dehydrogenase